MHNTPIDKMSRWDVARRTFWNHKTYKQMRNLIRRERPSLMHCHNTFPLISPAVYYAAQHEGVPVAQTLHNYRLFCVNGYFLRNERVCEDCLGKPLAWRGVLHVM